MAFSIWGQKRSKETTIECPKCKSIMVIGRT